MMIGVVFLIPVLALIFLLVNLYRWRAAVTENDPPLRIYYFRLALGCALFLAPIALNLIRVFGLRFLRLSLLGSWGAMAFVSFSSLSFAIGLWLLGTAWFFRWRARTRKAPEVSGGPSDNEGVWPPPPKSLPRDEAN